MKKKELNEKILKNIKEPVFRNTFYDGIVFISNILKEEHAKSEYFDFLNTIETIASLPVTLEEFIATQDK